MSKIITLRVHIILIQTDQGPSTLSIASPQALHAVHLNPRCLKGPWYQVLAPESSIQTDRDAAGHAARRKVWDRGFSTKALRNYEPRVTHYTDKLVAHIDSHVGQGDQKPLDASLWFNFYSFDVMGDLSLGESFGMLDRGEAHYAMRTLHSYMFMLGVFGHVMWAFRVIGNLPVLGAENVRFKAWVAEQVKKRIEVRRLLNTGETQVWLAILIQLLEPARYP